MTEILKTILTNLWYIMLILGVLYIIYGVISVEIERKKRKENEEKIDEELKAFSKEITEALVKSIEENSKKENKCKCEKKTKKNK